MKKIVTALVAFMLTLTAVCSLTACKNENAPSTGWDVKRFTAQTDNTGAESATTEEEPVHKLGFTVGDGTKKLSEVWVNIPKMYESSIELSVDVYSSTSDNLIKRTASPTYPTFTRKVLKDELKDAKKINNWIKLGFNDKWSDKDATYSKYVMLTVKGVFDFNEIVFIGEDGKKLSVSLSKIDYYYESEENGIVREAKTLAEISGFEKSPYKLIDEQDLFDLRDKK